MIVDKGKDRGLMVNISYPINDEYEFETFLQRVDLDKKAEESLDQGNGFIIADSKKSFDKDLRDPEGMFSPNFGQTLSDMNPFMHRYKCQCGKTQMKFYNGFTCPHCGTQVRRVDDNYEYFGWKILNNNRYIHPNIFESIQSLIGADRLDQILYYVDERDEDGHISTGNKRKSFKNRKKTPKSKDKFDGIGINAFIEKYDEIIEYYHRKKSGSDELYNDLVKNKSKTFPKSIPVFTTYLRPYDNNGKDFPYESTNGMYKMILTHATILNKNELKIDSFNKAKEESLYKLQMNINRLYQEIIDILSGKKGNIRQLFGGRYAHTARAVIVQNPQLEIDQVTLPYFCLVELLQHQIVNILMKSNNISYYDASNILDRATRQPDEMIIKIINSILMSNGKGLPILINRNPTINRGGVLQMYCVGMTMTYTMGIPLQILKLLAADFDGDALNIMLIINKAFSIRAEQLLNPRNSMYISNNNGRTNTDVIPNKDTIKNANAMIYLSRDKYSKEQLDNIYKMIAENINLNH